MKNKKYIAHVLFGKCACRELVDDSVREFKRCAKKFDGVYQSYEFNTEEERSAFYWGLMEGNGWEEFESFSENK